MKLYPIPLLTATICALTAGCKREKAFPFDDNDDTIPIGAVVGIDSDRAAFYADSVRRANDPAYRDSMEKAEAEQRNHAQETNKSHESNASSGDDNPDKEAEKELRRKKFWRGYDRGYYDENVHGYDRDNYDPDIDDW